MKTRGFTMIELLAIITILATILLISFPTLINMTRRDKERQYNDMVATLCKAGETYIYDNIDNYPNINTVGNVEYVDIDYLKDDGLVSKNQTNPKTGDNIFGNIRYTTQSDKSLKCYYEENMPIPNMLTESTEKNREVGQQLYFLNTSIVEQQISKLYIHNDGINVPEGYDSQDCSYLQDSSVICYWKEDSENTGFYEMNIAANGYIYTPFDSLNLFRNMGYNLSNAINKIDLSGINTKYTINMDSMFAGLFCKNLDLGDKFDTSNVTNMEGMFASLELLENINLGDKFDTSNVTNMGGMFSYTSSLTSLDLRDKFDTSNVIDMPLMFNYMSSLTNLDLGRKFVIKDNTNTGNMFTHCGRNGTLTQVIVPNDAMKTKVYSLAPEWWTTNNIIQVAQ